MLLRRSATFAAAMTAWVLAVGAAGVAARAQQSDRPVPIATAQRFDSVKMCFDHARALGFPAAGTGPPYVLRAEFTTRTNSGAVATGTYTDTWVSDNKWRREAVVGNSRFVRSRSGKKHYRLDEGPDAALLQFVLTAMEPIPATDSLTESDWKITREVVDGVATIRVARGKENADGTLDPTDSEGYWFDETGQLVSTTLNELQTRRSKFEEFNGTRVARQVEIVRAGKVGMRLDVTGLGPAVGVNSHMFTIKKHDWMRQNTSELR